MLAMDLLRHPDKIPLKPIFAVSGDDAYLRREALAAIVTVCLGADADEFSVSHFPGESASLSSVLDEVRTLPFLAKRRVVIVEVADPFVSAHRRELEAYAERPSSSGVLVLSVKSWPGNTKLAKLVEKQGLAIECKTPGERELPRWLISMTKTRSGVTLEDEAAQLLVDLVGAETGILVNEVEKLITYVGSRRQITRKDVAIMVDAGKIQEVWTAIDAATIGLGEQALVVLDRLLETKESEYRIMGGISYSLLKTYHAGLLRQARLEGAAACREAGIYPRDVEKTLRQHSHLGPTRVGQLPERLLRTDLEIKGTSNLPARVVMETLFVELSSSRKD